MFAIVGFGMNALDPNEPTILMMTCIGVGTAGSPPGAGAAGSSSARNLPAAVDMPFCEFTTEGAEGEWVPLQPQTANVQTVAIARNANFVRMKIARSKPNARGKS